MFDKFGEMDSAEEINKCAKAQKEQGDNEAIMTLAKENGIDEDDALDFIDGITKDLTSPLLAAIGKLEVEAKELNMKGILLDWVEELIDMCVGDESFAAAVRKKGKNLCELIALWIDNGYNNRIEVDKRITDKTKDTKNVLGGHNLVIGEPNRRERKVIAIKYYTEG